MIGEVSAILEPGDFFLQAHQDIWQRIKELEAGGQPVDLVSVGPAVGLTEQHLLTQAVNITPSLTALEYYESIVFDLSRRRALIQIVSETAKQTYRLDQGIDQIVGEHYTRLTGVMRGIGGEARRMNPDAVLDKYLTALATPKDVWGLRTGWGAYDIELGGAHLSEVILVAGEPKMGKSIWAVQTGLQMAGVRFFEGQMLDEVPGAIFEMEMTEEALQRRAACALAKVSARKVMTGRLGHDEQIRFTDALKRVVRAPVFVSDRTDWTTATVQVEVSRLIRAEGIKWVVVDYAGLLKDEADNLVEREVQISQRLHDIAKLGVAVLVVETLNKGGFLQKGPAAVRGSVQKLYDTDVLLFLDAAEKGGNKNLRTLSVILAREADRGMHIPLRMFGDQKRLEPWEGSLEAMSAEEIPF